jgi:hypothetical protein
MFPSASKIIPLNNCAVGLATHFPPRAHRLPFPSVRNDRVEGLFYSTNALVILSIANFTLCAGRQ